jgi:hypothetical protein
MAAVTIGAVLFLFSLQITASGLLFAATPAEREGRVGALDASASSTRLVEAQRKDLWLAARGPGGCCPDTRTPDARCPVTADSRVCARPDGVASTLAEPSDDQN